MRVIISKTVHRFTSILGEPQIAWLARRYSIGGGYRRIYHYHVRKTAGTSLNAAFWALAGLDLKTMGRRQRVVKDGYVFVRHHIGMIERGHYFYANSHIPAHSLRLPPQTFTITILRDPIQRVISHYRYLLWVRDDPNAPQLEPFWEAVLSETKWLRKSFHEFLDRVPRQHLLRQLYMFFENYDVNEALERILRCSAVLFTEQFGRQIQYLSDVLSLPLKERRERQFRSRAEVQLSSDERR